MADIFDYLKFAQRVIQIAFVICIIGSGLSTYHSLRRGNFQEGFEPFWLDFAVTYPTLFGIFLVVGTLAIGEEFVALVENS